MGEKTSGIKLVGVAHKTERRKRNELKTQSEGNKNNSRHVPSWYLCMYIETWYILTTTSMWNILTRFPPTIEKVHKTQKVHDSYVTMPEAVKRDECVIMVMSRKVSPSFSFFFFFLFVFESRTNSWAWKGEASRL